MIYAQQWDHMTPPPPKNDQVLSPVITKPFAAELKQAGAAPGSNPNSDSHTHNTHNNNTQHTLTIGSRKNLGP